MGLTTWRSTLAVTSGAAVALIVLRQLRVRDVAAARRLRTRLEGAVCQAVERFEPGMVTDLPEPARRYFLHAIRPGTPLARSVRLTMTGEMRLGPRQPWLRLQARQTFAPPAGFVWEAGVGRGLMRFAGADTYANGQGRVAFRLWDLAPVVRASGPDVSRAARGRLAIESIWQPAALLPRRGVTWTSIDERTVRAVVTIDGEAIPLTLTVAPDGRLESVAMERWGNLTPDGRYAAIPFGVNVLSERTFGGYTVPSGVRVAWWHGTDRAFEFFRAEIVQAAFLPSEQHGVWNDPPRDALPQTPWRHAAIVAIKLVHSLIFLLNSAAILHIFVAGLRGRPSGWTRAALAAALTEVAIFVANRRRCPLTDLVEHLGAENGRVSDIFLPRWLADRIPQLCGPPLLIGVLALAWHRWVAARITRSG